MRIEYHAVKPTKKMVDAIIDGLSAEERKYIDKNSIFSRPDMRCIATINKKPIGFVETKIYGDDAHVNIAVLKEYRRIGVATQLCDELMAWFFFSEASCLRWTCRGGNEASIGLALQLGMREIENLGMNKMRYFCLDKE